MVTILDTKSIYFNDVNVMQGEGQVESRSLVPDERFRIIVSPMPSVVGPTFIEAAAKNGLSVAVPRILPHNEKARLRNIFFGKGIIVSPRQSFFHSIRLNEDLSDLQEVRRAYDGIQFKSILIDMANGWVPQLSKKVKEISDVIGNIDELMIGNVMSAKGVDYITESCLPFCRQLYVRVGIGNGGPCATSDTTGVNRGQVTELKEIEAIKYRLKNVYIVSDGGIKNGGYATKAFACGADYVLMGSYFAKAKEAETHISGDGNYYGCASKRHIKMEGTKRHSEGKEHKIEDKLESLEDLTFELWGGIQSAVSYAGFKTLSDMIGNGTLERKENSLPPKKRV